MSIFRGHILIGFDESGVQAGAKEVKNAFEKNLAKLNLDDEYKILETGPLGFFGQGVCLMVYPEQIYYHNVTPENVPLICEEHLLKGRPVKDLLFDKKTIELHDFNYKNRIVLDHSGLIDPENIEEYIGANGYLAWEKALTQMKPNDIVNEVKKSELRGRGGAGFTTGLKWSFTAPIESDDKLIVINADEGEPGTFKDRLIMEGDPHKLLEGIMIAAYAVGAHNAYIYVRGEYKLCIARLRKAIQQAKEYGLLGKNIMDSGFDLDIDIKIGAGAYVCGEETALIESMEGNRGTPRTKPPFPGVKGAWQKPTVVNNVETIANVPFIILNGADAYKAHGTGECFGTKVYTILGDVAYPGLCEVDMGVRLRDIINKFGGGMKDGKKFKAALVGGAAGVFLSDERLDVKMDFVSLAEYMAVLGSGAILVMNQDVSMIEMLYSVIRFFRHESCGKCMPCSVGTQELFVLINKVRNGYGTQDDLDKMLLIAQTMKDTAFCALGQSLIMPIKSAFDNFKEEFEAAVKNNE
ncbi:MAG: NADH-quinone oxidoreductase subunit NuoF [Candidatus Cloacimonetes bacterium]|jgi:NADH:ubiquinone oxidoreductase subunit F (NADH-binding)|nr:NADH-quinone oxidoreductase subunit NuoF [Candidatus Cloacimonadota bacterium]MDD4155116.1 NADH-quinone oxidoreductase subunit NuoF [Candidatus Cloacimonadota bacterium]